MKKLITISLLLLVVVGYAWVDQKKFALAPNITGGVFHGTTACTTSLGTYLYGAKAALFTLRADTIVDTVSYYFFALSFKGINQGTYGSNIPIGVDSITLNSEGTTKAVSDTLDVGGDKTFMQRYGLYQYSRVMVYPTVLAAKQGLKT